MKTLLIILTLFLMLGCEIYTCKPQSKTILDTDIICADSVLSDSLFSGYYWIYVDSIPFQYWDVVQSEFYIGVVVALYDSHFITQYYEGYGKPGKIFIRIGSTSNWDRADIIKH